MPRRPSPTLHLSSPAQLRALASATRQELVDILASAGPSSVARLAELMGRRPDALYFHLRALERAGLVFADSPARNNGSRNGATYSLPARILKLQYRPGTSRGISRVVRTALRLSQREFDRACASDAEGASASPRRLWGGRVMGWTDHASLHRINSLIDEAHSILRQGRPGKNRRAVSFGFILAPAGFGDRERRPRSNRKENP